MRRAGAVCVLLVVSLVGGCRSGPPNAWAEVMLPGGGVRVLRDAVACGGQWYVVGGRTGSVGGGRGGAGGAGGDGAAGDGAAGDGADAGAVADGVVADGAVPDGAVPDGAGAGADGAGADGAGADGAGADGAGADGAGGEGEIGPAAWTSSDGRNWRSLALTPFPGSYYGPRSTLYTVACANGRIAAIGAGNGGAHGNPRTSTWQQRPDGSLAEVAAPFETYGGDTAVDVGRLAGGANGFLIAGNRTSGAAAWLSPDGAAFRLIENAPGLAGGGATGRSLARDGAVLDGQWLLVGGIGASPASWVSGDGRAWRRVRVGEGGGFAELQRVARVGNGLVAVGVKGETFGAWRIGDLTAGRPPGGAEPEPPADSEPSGTSRPSEASSPSKAFRPSKADSFRGETSEGWAAAGRFGRADATGVRSLTVAGQRLYAAAEAGLWRSTDGGRSWLPVLTPRAAAPLSAVSVRDTDVLLVADDRLWLAHRV